MTTLTLPRWFARTPSAAPAPPPSRAKLRIGIPRVLNLWSTHQFWFGLFTALGIDPRHLVFSSDTSEEQGREFGKGRGTVDCCYPVKCMSGHYGELVFGQREKLDIIFSPMIYNLPSFLSGHVAKTLTCPRVMAAPENIKAGFLKERDVFAEQGIRYVAPFVSLDEPKLVPKQLFEGLRDALPGLTPHETARAVEQAYGRSARSRSGCASSRARSSSGARARTGRPSSCWPGRITWTPGSATRSRSISRPTAIRSSGPSTCPSTPTSSTGRSAPTSQAGYIRSPLDIRDIWPSSYSSNTNEIIWGAKFAARMPWIACVVRLSSYECGMDQPTYTPVQQTIERSGTLFFSFQDLDATKPAGSMKIRVETITHYLGGHAEAIIERKKAAMPPDCPLLPPAAP